MAFHIGFSSDLKVLRAEFQSSCQLPTHMSEEPFLNKEPFNFCKFL
jgi:hypothetical protein